MNIALATADDYEYSYVALESLMQNIDTKIKCNFYLLTPSNFSFEQAFLKLEEVYTHCRINFLKIGNEFDNAEIHVPHTNKPTYYRLLLPELLPNEEKCLYLDSDIIACSDLTKLYDINISDFLVAGVKAVSYHCAGDAVRDYCIQNHLKSLDQYINAGVLLMNLHEMRNCEFSKKALQMISYPHSSQDQDIVNILCYNRIKFLSFRFNAMTKYYEWTANQYNGVFSKEEIEEAWTEPVIIHYADARKPWSDLQCPLSEKWWNVCRNSAQWEHFYHKMQSYSVNKKIGDNIDMAPKCIVIYGVGEFGRNLYEFLRNTGMKISYFCQSEASERSEYDGIKILQAKQLATIKDILVMIAINDTEVCERIKMQLISMKIDSSNIYIWSEFLVRNNLRDKKYNYCLLCGNYVQEFLPDGVEQEIFDKHHIIGGGLRDNAACPVCNGIDRVRWQYYVLNNFTDILHSECSVLHFAPEYMLEQKIRQNKDCDYYSGDIITGRANHKVNITDIQFKDGFFDYIIANHVLEHIKDERQAVLEMKRVLKSTGKMIISFPICTDMPTFEEDSIISEEDRLKYYGQNDHVRLYGMDYKSRFENYGLKVDIKTPSLELSDYDVIRLGLISDDVILICSKSPDK